MGGSSPSPRTTAGSGSSSGSRRRSGPGSVEGNPAQALLPGQQLDRVLGCLRLGARGEGTVDLAQAPGAAGAGRAGAAGEQAVVLAQPDPAVARDTHVAAARAAGVEHVHEPRLAG